MLAPASHRLTVVGGERSTQTRGAPDMNIRFLATASAALLLAVAPAVQSQPASAPAATSATPASAPKPTAAPAPAAAATSSDAAEGKVAYYGRKFAGRKTASGERFNPAAMTMAHKSLPFGTLVRVTNLKTKKSVVVRVNDRGPTTPDRIGDVSAAAAKKLRMLRSGVIDAKLEVVGKAKGRKMAGKAKKKA
jgi:rare lipoprotein A